MSATIRDLFRKSKESWLEDARAAAIKLLKRRPYITIDDVTKEVPLPSYLHKNTVGGVFQTPDFKAVGFTVSTRPVAHGRVIRKWALR